MTLLNQLIVGVLFLPWWVWALVLAPPVAAMIWMARRKS